MSAAVNGRQSAYTKPHSPYVRLVFDLALWLVAPCAFLIWYTRYSQVPAAVVVPHLLAATAVWLVLAVFRLFIVGLMKGRRGAAAVSGAAAAAFLMTMLVYYGLVVFGLRSWGRVISHDLIWTYLVQAPAVADAMGLDLRAIGAIAALVYLVLFGAAWLFIRSFDWVAPFFRTRSEHAYALITGVVLVMICGALGCFIAFPPVHVAEPVSLTVFPELAAANVQGQGIDPMRSAHLDSAEDAERRRYTAAAGVEKRNVILFVVDALRSDRMGVYGYSRDTTPHLDRLDRAGLLRKLPEVRASCSSTTCGITSLISSKYIHQFSKRPFSLYEVLRLHGYRVHLILGGDHTNFYELKSVYGEVDTYFDGANRRDGYMSDDRILLDRAAALPSWDGVPVLIQFHLMSVHAAGMRHPDYNKFLPAHSYLVPTRAAPVHGGNFYDNGVLQADGTIHQLLVMLRSKGYLSNTVVVVTADHGEGLGEHGFYGHARGIDEEVLRIPLIFLAEGYTPRPLPQSGLPVAQVDIAPTILSELGMEKPRTWSGFALDKPIARDFTYLQDGDFLGLMDLRDPANVWKYTVHRGTREEQAFNMSRDPGARKNAIAEVAATLKRDWHAEYIRMRGGTSLLH